MTTKNILENRIDTDGFQWIENGQRYSLSDLSREDLIQVACQSMDLINRTENRVLNLSQKVSQDMELWNNGRPLPPDPMADE